MDNFYFIGVDVSKKKLDFCVLFEGKVLREEQVTKEPLLLIFTMCLLSRDGCMVV